MVRVGIYELNETNLASRTYRAFRTYIHPSYKPESVVAYDIGLIRLFFPIQFLSKQIEPTCLNLVEKKTYDDLLISGWGAVTRSYQDSGMEVVMGKLSNVLKYTYYYEMSDMDLCKPQLICANPRNSKDSACHGDSGKLFLVKFVTNYFLFFV